MNQSKNNSRDFWATSGELGWDWNEIAGCVPRREQWRESLFVCVCVSVVNVRDVRARFSCSRAMVVAGRVTRGLVKEG